MPIRDEVSGCSRNLWNLLDCMFLDHLRSGQQQRERSKYFSRIESTTETVKDKNITAPSVPVLVRLLEKWCRARTTCGGYARRCRSHPPPLSACWRTLQYAIKNSRGVPVHDGRLVPDGGNSFKQQQFNEEQETIIFNQQNTWIASLDSCLDH